ncbi:STM3941 family protein [Flavobacterium tibetense]|uniref:Uncharacterized protein n=1 Tax=Flavobacterium tibetense TaxID=2233533 RepID=A0A365NZT2_9FLAO|nr:STM3941 family protein [Flavobacterium tibetense]RBA27740.1 hypothetical protein DPN68_10420 [Flavobacterium tibetense]
MKKNIEIKLDKKKILKSLFYINIFFLTCFLFVLTPQTFTSVICRNKHIIFTIGILGIILALIYLYPLFSKLFKNKAGLIINENGIFNNTEYLNLGFIKWSDVISVKTKTCGKGKYLLLELENEDEYMKRLDNCIFKFYAKFNKVQYGTIVHITHSTLDCSFEDLERLILSSYNQNKQIIN